jgi:hypothetical protein
LKKEYPATSAVVLVAALKRSLVSVQRQLREMGVGKRKPSSWTPRELRLLRRLYPTTAIWEVANQLGKTPSDVKRKAAGLRLKKR